MMTATHPAAMIQSIHENWALPILNDLSYAGATRVAGSLQGPN